MMNLSLAWDDLGSEYTGGRNAQASSPHPYGGPPQRRPESTPPAPRAGGVFYVGLTRMAGGRASSRACGWGRIVSLVRHSASAPPPDRKSTRLNSSHGYISYAVFCLKKKE